MVNRRQRVPPRDPAIVAVVDALILIGHVHSSLPHLRAAEHLAARALFTNAHLQFLPPQRRSQIAHELRGRHAAAADLQAVITGADEPSRSTTMLAMERVPLFERQGQKLAERQSYDAAADAFELAVTDQLLLLGTVAREDPDNGKVPDALPESFLAVVRDGGAAEVARLSAPALRTAAAR